MEFQIIFAVESNRDCQSDYIYIKDTVEHFYDYDHNHVKLTPVFMDGKGKYEKKKKEIDSLVSQHKYSGKENESQVVYCFDCDDYDSKQEDLKFLQTVTDYCSQNGYALVWFCKDVEQVYLGKKIPRKEKKKESARFKHKKLIQSVDSKRLSVKQYKIGSSNIMCVLSSEPFSKYLKRKENP